MRGRVAARHAFRADQERGATGGAALHKTRELLVKQRTMCGNALRGHLDKALAKTCTTHATTDCGHGRIDERSICVTDDIGWLKDLHPNWADLRCIIAVTSVRTHKKSGATSKETRFYITSLPPDPERILAAIRAHWGIENTLHWSLDVTFREDSSRLRKDNAAANMAVIRKAAFNALKRLPSKLSLKLRRVQVSLDPGLPFRVNLLLAFFRLTSR